VVRDEEVLIRVIALIIQSEAHHLRKAYSNVCGGKTFLKYTDHSQLTESGNIKHIDLTGADNGNMPVLQGGQDDQTVVCLALPLMQHKDVSLGLLRCHYPFLGSFAGGSLNR
jgi:hypothetical protein